MGRFAQCEPPPFVVAGAFLTAARSDGAKFRQHLAGQELEGFEEGCLGKRAVIHVKEMPVELAGLLELGQAIENLLGAARHQGALASLLVEIGGG